MHKRDTQQSLRNQQNKTKIVDQQYTACSALLQRKTSILHQVLVQ